MVSVNAGAVTASGVGGTFPASPELVHDRRTMGAVLVSIRPCTVSLVQAAMTTAPSHDGWSVSRMLSRFEFQTVADGYVLAAATVATREVWLRVPLVDRDVRRLARSVRAARKHLHQRNRRTHSARRPPPGLGVAMSPDAPLLPPACQIPLPMAVKVELPWPTAAVPLDRSTAARAPVVGAAVRCAVTGVTAGVTAAGAVGPPRSFHRLRGIPPADHCSDGGSDAEAPIRASPGGPAGEAGLVTRRRPGRPRKTRRVQLYPWELPCSC